MLSLILNMNYIGPHFEHELCWVSFRVLLIPGLSLSMNCVGAHSEQELCWAHILRVNYIGSHSERDLLGLILSMD
jgi:hypothetical protein